MSELADALSNEPEIAEIPSGQPEISGEEANPRSASPEKPLTIRDQINKSIETVRTEEAKRARTSDGKFTKLEASAESAAAQKPSESTTEQTVPHGGSNPDAPPSAWKAIWEKLPEEARAIAVKRETEVSKGFDEYRTKTTQLTEISQALEPLKPVLQQNGIQTEAQAVKRLIEWEGSFRNPQTRIQAFHNLAQQYGVDLRSLVQSPPTPSAAQDIPEPLRPVMDQFGNIVQKVDNLEARLQRADQDRVSAELSAFASKPEHAHFDKVRTIMGQLMNAGLVPNGDLESAYQKAILHHPEVSAQIKAEETAKATAELIKANTEKAARARQASISPGTRAPVGPTSNGVNKPRASSVKEAILSSIAELREGQRA
jgi:hypothetical protein